MPFNIYLKQASLKEFTAKIEQLSEYSFIYGEEVVLKHPITLDLKETPLTTILPKIRKQSQWQSQLQ
ncbi:hypothetical protein QNN11_19130 [Phocaeicola dorei]|uniref:Uncharacterized protein n=1 Tax=Phocaeicola dorei TaxID=357276 RepID=A0AA95HMW9_9BACT|nr:hypothetical protein QNN11_19130 [Phocaeicola dorei]